MKSKHSKKKSKKDFICDFLIIIFTIIIIYSGIKIYKWCSENKKTDDIIKEIEQAIVVNKIDENTEKFTIEFNKLKEKNFGYCCLDKSTKYQYRISSGKR